MKPTDVTRNIQGTWLDLKINDMSVVVHILEYTAVRLHASNHIHAGLEILAVKRGQVDVTYNSQKQVTLLPGDVSVVGNGVFHKEMVAPNTSSYVILFSLVNNNNPANVQISDKRLAEYMSRMEWQTFHDTSVMETMDELLTALEDRHVLAPSLAASLFLKLLLRTMHEAYPNYNSKKGKRANINLIRDIDIYFVDLSGDQGEELSIEEFAERFHIKPARAERLVRRVYNMTYKQKCIECRMLYAKHLLKNTDYPVAKVAEICGYTDMAYFSRLFKKKTGTSPKQYAKTVLR